MAKAKKHWNVFWVRLDDPVSRELENWRRRQPNIPARAEAIRDIVEGVLVPGGQTDRNNEAA